MINFDNPFFVSIRLKPKKEINAKNFVDGKMVDVLEKLQEENLDYLLVAGNIVKHDIFTGINEKASLLRTLFLKNPYPSSD